MAMYAIINQQQQQSWGLAQLWSTTTAACASLKFLQVIHSLLLTAQQRCCSDTRAVSAPNQKHDTHLTDTDGNPSLLLSHALVLGPFGHHFHQFSAVRTGILGSVPQMSGKIHQVTNVDLKINVHWFPTLKTTTAIETTIFLFHCQISENLQH